MATAALTALSAAAQQQPRPPPRQAATRPTPPADPMAAQTIGHRFQVTMGGRAAPYAQPTTRNSPIVVPRGDRLPTLPAGFTATLFADNLEGPRQILLLPNGDAIVAMQKAGHLVLLRDEDGDGRADWVQRHAAGFNQPHGLAFRPGEILVADQDGIWTIEYQDGLVRPPFAQPQPIADIPEGERGPSPHMDGQRLLTQRGVFGVAQGHANRDLEIAPDGQMFVGVGSAGNIGVEPSPKSTIQVFDARGGGQRTLASGMRNPSGLAFQPRTGDLWAVVQERDGLGDQQVPDFLARVRDGGFYGFPYAFIGPNPQPGFAERAPQRVRETLMPELLFEPHSAAMDLTFYDGPMLPPDYRGDAFVALKGSWNRLEPTGYMVVRVRFEDGKPAGWYETFMAGFWVEGTDRARVWGRPADVAVAPDGALFVVDDTGGTIWRVTYRAPDASPAAPPRGG